MPIYEFVCRACGQRSSVFQRSMSAELKASCPRCRSGDLEKLISQFAVLHSGADAFDDSAMAGLDENDPAAMERWARTMGDEIGEDFDADTDGGFGDDALGGVGGDDFDA